MQLHTLTRKNKVRKARRVGRGGKRGKTSGKGTKGQKARAGHKIRPEVRDIIKKLPKRRGYKFSSFAPKSAVVNLGLLNEVFKEGDSITPEILLSRGIIKRTGGKMPGVKVLAEGSLDKKLSLSGLTVSKGARTQIEKAGGSVVL
jgi:large subunit ribosomal protein L15